MPSFFNNLRVWGVYSHVLRQIVFASPANSDCRRFVSIYSHRDSLQILRFDLSKLYCEKKNH